MKKTKIVIPALAVLLLSTAASVSGTVAWFSMNTQIKVTGMTVTTKVSSNLQIATANNDALFSSDNLQQARRGWLEPASTVDGDSFFYTVNAKNNGEATGNPSVVYVAYNEATALGTDDKANSGKQSYDAAFNSAYSFAYNTDSTPGDDDDDNKGNGDVAFAYIDYSFYLKAYTAGSEKIALTRCNMQYDGGNLREHAWRVAFFASDVGQGVSETDADTTDPDNTNLVSILSFAESKNQNQVEQFQLSEGDTITASTLYDNPELTGTPLGAGEATAQQAGLYYKATENEAEPKAVASTSAVGALLTGCRDTTNHKGAKAEIVPGSIGNHYYKVVVRLWLEGEDVTCKSDTFAALTDEWTLDLGFKLGSEDGVQVISNNAAAQA